MGWELGIVKWSDSCTHKQRVRWSRREVEGLGVRERETRKRRIERGPGGERREEPAPRVLAPFLTDSTFSTITSWSARLSAVRDILLWNHIPHGRRRDEPLVMTPVVGEARKNSSRKISARGVYERRQAVLTTACIVQCHMENCLKQFELKTKNGYVVYWLTLDTANACCTLVGSFGFVKSVHTCLNPEFHFD